MNETKVRQEVFRVFKGLGEWPITQTDAARCPHCGRVVTPPTGRPDIIIPKAVCEVKVVPNGGHSLPASAITLEQRRWLDAWVGAHGDGAYLAVGTLTPRRRRLWVAPWTAWRQLEDEVLPVQASVPVRAGPGMRRELQDASLDIETWLAEHELSKVAGGWEPTQTLKETFSDNGSKPGTCTGGR